MKRFGGGLRGDQLGQMLLIELLSWDCESVLHLQCGHHR